MTFIKAVIAGIIVAIFGLFFISSAFVGNGVFSFILFIIIIIAALYARYEWDNKN